MFALKFPNEVRNCDGEKIPTFLRLYTVIYFGQKLYR